MPTDPTFAVQRPISELTVKELMEVFESAIGHGHRASTRDVARAEILRRLAFAPVATIKEDRDHECG